MDRMDILFHFILLDRGEYIIMYKVMKIINYMATRDVVLRNLETGTEDLCFDDSAVVSYTNFNFIEEGKIYDCKIELFGDFVDRPTESSTEVTIIETGVIIGKYKYFKVKINSNIYYILESDAKGHEIKPKMYYDCTRKDLAQVDDVIHGDCLS